MNTIENTQDGEQHTEKKEDFTKTSGKISQLLEEYEVFSMQGAGKGSLDISKFSESQLNEILSILKTNEHNAFQYHCKKLEVAEKIHLKIIGSNTINQRTLRYTFLSVIALTSALTFLIIVYRQDFFIPWLSFMAGLAGGVGLTKFISYSFRNENPDKIIDE